MFVNLRTALFREGITMGQYARQLGVCEKTAYSKIRGKTDFSYNEFRRTCDMLPGYNAEYLFEDDSRNKSA